MDLRGEVAEAEEIVASFAVANGWEETLARKTFDAVEIFKTHNALWQRVLSINGMPLDTALPPGTTMVAGIEKRVLVAVCPDEYAKVYPEYGSQPDSWRRLIAHEIAHRLHVNLLDGNEDAMGPSWFFEGFAVIAAGQTLDHGLVYTTATEAFAGVREKGPLAYRRFSAAVRYFLKEHPLKELVDHAGKEDFEGGLETQTHPAPSSSVTDDESCAIIVTDDDIPSGSPIAGALYVEEAAFGKGLLTADVVAAAQGFKKAGLTCVDVIDSHDGAIDPDPLGKIGVPVLTPSNTEGWVWPFLGPMKKKYVIAALIGFHSNAGQLGFRAHTINDGIKALSIDSKTVGEVAHLLLGLGSFDIPVGLVSGDMNAVAEALGLCPQAGGVVVRWLSDQGETEFLSSEAAAQRLSQSAIQAVERRGCLFRPSLPVDVAVATYSKEAVRDKAKTCDRDWEKEMRESGLETRHGIETGTNMQAGLTNGSLHWSSKSARLAFLQIAFAASYLRGSNNWEAVDNGYRAFKEKRFSDAVQFYAKALEQNPYDVPTRCRLGAVYLDLGELKRAQEMFAYALGRQDEIGGPLMESWCWIGIAETENKLGNVEAAHHAARKVLELPDSKGRHEKAKNLLGIGVKSGLGED